MSLVKSAPAKGGDVTYTFKAGSPGTYVYHSGHGRDQAARDGALRRARRPRRAAGKAKQANADTTSAFSKEFLLLVSQVDPDWHAAVERNRAYDVTKSTARYFLINGRSMPDTLAPNNAGWLPAQPYSGLIHITADPATGAANHAPALIRYANAGPTNYPFHPHGSSQTVVTRDGAAVHDANERGRELREVPARRRAGAEHRCARELEDGVRPVVQRHSVRRPVAPAPGPDRRSRHRDVVQRESLSRRNQGRRATNITQNNACGEYYHVAHSHALYQATNYGASFGGMMTLIRIDPPNRFNCVQGSDYQ